MPLTESYCRPYFWVRVKRLTIRKKVWWRVQQKGKNAWNKTCWITLVTVATRNEAYDVLVDKAEMLRRIESERIHESFGYNSSEA